MATWPFEGSSIFLHILMTHLIVSAFKGSLSASASAEITSTADSDGYTADSTCAPGWNQIDDDCYFFDESIKLSWFEARAQCQTLGGTLPSIHYESENDWLQVLARAHFGSLPENNKFWIGLVCEKNAGGKFAWIDNSPVNYQKIQQDVSECTNANMGYYYMDDTTWNGTLSISDEKRLVCSKIGPYPTDATSEAPGDPDPPVWVWVLVGISVILGFILLFTVIVFVFRWRSSKAKMVEVQIENSRKVTQMLADQEKARYYNLPIQNNSDEWEIERRFVNIDYSRKLGDGAFGSVFLGRVLAKNIPTGVGRSIAELAALTNGNEEVAVKMLHENADVSAESEFRAEIYLMKRIDFYDRLGWSRLRANAITLL